MPLIGRYLGYFQPPPSFFHSTDELFEHFKGIAFFFFFVWKQQCKYKLCVRESLMISI